MYVCVCVCGGGGGGGYIGGVRVSVHLKSCVYMYKQVNSEGDRGWAATAWARVWQTAARSLRTAEAVEMWRSRCDGYC